MKIPIDPPTAANAPRIILPITNANKSQAKILRINEEINPTRNPLMRPSIYSIFLPIIIANTPDIIDKINNKTKKTKTNDPKLEL